MTDVPTFAPIMMGIALVTERVPLPTAATTRLVVTDELCTITVASKPGEGSSFSFAIPASSKSRPDGSGAARVQRHLQEELPSSGENARLAGFLPTALVVHEGAEFADAAGRLFRDAGCLVATANSAERALKMARAIGPHLIVVDTTTRELDGWAIMREVRSDPEMQARPIVFVATHDAQTEPPLGTECLRLPLEARDVRSMLRKHGLIQRSSQVMPSITARAISSRV